MKYLPDLLLIVGASSVSYGSWLIFQPSGYVIGGMLLLIQAVKMAQAK